MKQAHTTKRNFRTMAAFAAALLALAAAGTALAEKQYVSLTVQGPVDTRTGTRAADETEPILLSARLPGAGGAELVIDGIAYGPVENVAPDGQIFDRTYEWAYPEFGEEDSDVVHEMVLEKEGAPIYKAYFGGPIIEKHSLNGISMGWLVNWKDFVAEHFLGNYEKAAQGFTLAGVPMYDAYVAAMDPTDRNAKISFIAERLAEDENRIRFSVAGSHPTEAIGPRRYVLQATDSLMPDGSGTAPVWRDVGELPNGTLDLPAEDVRALGRFLRVAVRLPQTASDGALAQATAARTKSKPVARSASLSLGTETRGFTSAAASSKELSVTANVSWTAKSSASWLTVKTASGSGNGKIVYNVAANTGSSSRTAKITVSGGGLTRTFTVLQNGKEGADYMVVDLSGGSSAAWYPVSYLSAPPSGGWADEHKTTKLVLRRIAAGAFAMGSPSGESGRSANETQHTVTLSKPYYIGVFEVTQKQWKQVMGDKYNTSGFVGDKLPVEKVTWNYIRGSTGWPASPGVSSAAFMGCLRARTGLADFDLPTEAQWECACRAGTATAYAHGAGADGNYMWYTSNSSSKTHEVGTKKPNAWGLYDMHGNVWEWCLDWYGDAYGTAAATDPKGAASGEYRIMRGGSWKSGASSCRSAYRGYNTPSKTDNTQGFRVAKTSAADGGSGGGGSSATLTLSSTSRSFTADAASSKELSVTATVSWTAKSSASWLTVKTASGSGNGKIVYNVAANSGTAERSATITVSGGGKTATFTVTQSGKSGGGGGSATLTLSSTSRSFTADAASSKELSVTATVSWTAKSSASWLTVKTASGSGNGKIVYNVAANTGTASRTATITVSGGGKTATFTATQSGKSGGGGSATLSLKSTSRTFTADAANNKEVSVTATVSWTAKSSASWLTVKTASGSGNGKIVYNVAANSGTSSRTATITVSGGGKTATFTVTQSGKAGDGALYMVVDLSAGSEASSYPVSYLNEAPSGGWTDEYKTTKMVLRRIDPGIFTMGSPASEEGHDWSETQHTVTLSALYYIGVFEVTQKQWLLVMGSNPSEYEGDKRPVEKVSWDMIHGSVTGPTSSGSFMGRLRARTGLDTFDLPTEAQWEYACRAGTTTAFSYGNTADSDYMWCGSNTSGTHEVGTKKPNAWGLYDMHGNVYEWCLDWGVQDYGTDPVIDPWGPSTGSYRVYRGGSWYIFSRACRSANRSADASSKMDKERGFRVVRRK